MNIQNCTPHAIHLILAEASHTFPPSDFVARVEEQLTPFSTVNDIPVEHMTRSKVVNLPPPAPDTIYIVSRVVAEAAPERTDLVSPGQLVRDQLMRVVGCRTFVAGPGMVAADAAARATR